MIHLPPTKTMPIQTREELDQARADLPSVVAEAMRRAGTDKGRRKQVEIWQKETDKYLAGVERGLTAGGKQADKQLALEAKANKPGKRAPTEEEEASKAKDLFVHDVQTQTGYTPAQWGNQDLFRQAPDGEDIVLYKRGKKDPSDVTGTTMLPDAEVARLHASQHEELRNKYNEVFNIPEATAEEDEAMAGDDTENDAEYEQSKEAAQASPGTPLRSAANPPAVAPRLIEAPPPATADITPYPSAADAASAKRGMAAQKLEPAEAELARLNAARFAQTPMGQVVVPVKNALLAAKGALSDAVDYRPAMAALRPERVGAMLQSNSNWNQIADRNYDVMTLGMDSDSTDWRGNPRPADIPEGSRLDPPGALTLYNIARAEARRNAAENALAAQKSARGTSEVVTE